MSTRHLLVPRLIAAAALVVGMFAVAPAVGAQTCAYNSTQSTCGCPTAGAGTSCFGGQLFRASDNSCQNDARPCLSNQNWDCSSESCVCNTVSYPCGGCTAASSTIGASCTTPTNGLYTNVCGACSCPVGTTLCSSSNTCVATMICPAGTSFDPCTNSCGTPNVLLSPGWIQSGYIQVNGDVKSTGGNLRMDSATGGGQGDMYVANGKAIRVDGTGSTLLNMSNWGVGGTGFQLNIIGLMNATQVCVSGNCRNTWPGTTDFDPLYVNVAGDTMTGSLALSGASTNLTVGGKVGIGAAAVTYPLEVTGSGKFTGQLGVGIAPSASQALNVSGGSSYGIYATTPGPYGVYGTSTSAGTAYGVYGLGTNYGVGGSGTTAGVIGSGPMYGSWSSGAGAAAYFENSSAPLATWTRIGYKIGTTYQGINSTVGPDSGILGQAAVFTNTVSGDQATFGGYISGVSFAANFQGNVGIGTLTAPTSKLDVNGTAKMTGLLLPTGAGAGKVLTSDASGNGTWQPVTGPVSSVAGSGAGINVTPTTGNVVVSNTGVTSAVAGTDMSVSGATGAVTFNDTSTLQTVTGRGPTTTNSLAVGSSSLAPNTQLYVQGAQTAIGAASTNVNSTGAYITANSAAGGTAVKGVGTYVGVQGSAVGAGGTYGVYGDAAANNGFGVYGSATGSPGFGVFGTSTNSYGVYGYTSAAAYGVYGMGPSAVAGVYGTSNTGFGVQGSSPVSAGGQFSGVTGVNVSGSSYGVYSSGGTNYFSGNVGVGTTTPDLKMTVSGDVRVGERGVYTGGAANYGKAVVFSGANGLIPGYSGDNSDPQWMARYNSGSNTSELRLSMGDDSSGDSFAVGYCSGFADFSTGCTWTPTATFTSNGNLAFQAANPTISAPSYFVAPGGAYFNSGTVYTEAAIQARGGIHNDTGGNLVLQGGTSGVTSTTGPMQVNAGSGGYGLQVNGTTGTWGPSVGMNNGTQEWRAVSWSDNSLKFVKITGLTFTPLTIYNDSYQDELELKSNGISLSGKHAFRSSDSWLRLNQDGAFTSGVHTPGNFAPGALNVGGANAWGNPGGGNAWIAGNLTVYGSMYLSGWRSTWPYWNETTSAQNIYAPSSTWYYPSCPGGYVMTGWAGYNCQAGGCTRTYGYSSSMAVWIDAGYTAYMVLYCGANF